MHVLFINGMENLSPKDKPKALKRDYIYNIDMLFWKKGFQTFIYIYYKNFDIHRWPSPTGSFYAFCVNLLKKKDPKVIDQRSWYIYTWGLKNDKIA